MRRQRRRCPRAASWAHRRRVQSWARIPRRRPTSSFKLQVVVTGERGEKFCCYIAGLCRCRWPSVPDGVLRRLRHAHQHGADARRCHRRLSLRTELRNLCSRRAAAALEPASNAAEVRRRRVRSAQSLQCSACESRAADSAAVLGGGRSVDRLRVIESVVSETQPVT